MLTLTGPSPSRITMRSCTRAHPPTVPNRARSSFCGEYGLKANVVGSLRSLNYRGPGSSSRPKDLPPASADPDRTHFTTLTTRDGESPSTDDHRAIRRRPPGHPQMTTGPSADDHRAIRPQTTSGHPQADDLRPSASRRPPTIRKQTTSGHPQADDLRPSADDLSRGVPPVGSTPWGPPCGVPLSAGYPWSTAAGHSWSTAAGIRGRPVSGTGPLPDDPGEAAIAAILV